MHNEFIKTTSIEYKLVVFKNNICYLQKYEDDYAIIVFNNELVRVHRSELRHHIIEDGMRVMLPKVLGTHFDVFPLILLN